MKKVFVLSLAVIFGFALVMGCATMQTKDVKKKEALTMGNGGNKKMKIKAKKDTGEILKVSEENGNDATEVLPAEIEQIYQSGGFKYVALILHAHSSPGCWYYYIGGRYYKICVEQP